jgi:ATP phosphoribosyltransferase regulatory subunit
MVRRPPISLPQGVRDILPDESERIGAAESAILSVFARHGFRRIITPLLEYVEVLSLGMGENLRERVLKFIDPSTGHVVAIRPDITPQIARVVATRMRDAALPLKLCYNESVLRYQEAGEGKSREVLQAGAEQITEAPSPEADAEMVVIAIEALHGAGLRDFKIDIGDVGFLRAVLDGIGVAEPERSLIRQAVAVKDSSALSAALGGAPVKDNEKRLLMALPTLYGEEEVIEKAAGYAITPEALASLDGLRRTLGIITGAGYRDFITVDLGEMRGFDYYTGMIFEGFASGVGRPILGGGRYDNLIARYGYPRAATGFAFDIENIVAALGKRL